MSINSISKIIDSVSLILGPMLGGIVFAVVDIKTFYNDKRYFIYPFWHIHTVYSL